MQVEDKQEERKNLEKACSEMADVIRATLPEGVAFSLILADFGEQGNLAYCSNANREDMIKLLRETANKIEGTGN